MDTEFPRGRGGPSRKIMEIPGGGGSTVKPPGTKNHGGWGSTWKKTLHGGYGYFLEPHIVNWWFFYKNHSESCYVGLGKHGLGQRRNSEWKSFSILSNECT